MTQEVLSMKGITKIYPNGFVANNNVDFMLRKGEIHALLGENGAGKTTLMKILFGFEDPEFGEIYLNGDRIKIKDPLDAIAKGIGMVHQHFMLVPSLSVAENIVLGYEPKKGIMFDFEAAVKITEELSLKYKLHVDPRSKVKDLSVGVKQKIEILKALLRGAEILILDEPTAVLTPQETEELFVELKRLREFGHTIVFISHKLDEVKEICDRYTVLRRGESVGVGLVADTTTKEMSRLMVGRDVLLEIKKEPYQAGDLILDVSNLSYRNQEGKSILSDVAFTVRQGQVLGIAGIEGNGQTELSELLTGLRTGYEGSICVNGKEIRDLTIREIRENGVSNISEDRMVEGASANATIQENIIVDRYYEDSFSSHGILNHKFIARDVSQKIIDFEIKCSSQEEEINMLSGGNIQKVIVARELTSNSNLIVANQPTRGIDVGTTEFIRTRLVELTRKKQIGVLLISADINEVLDVSDSLLVFRKGEIVAYFTELDGITDVDVGEYMLGIRNMWQEGIHEKTIN